MRERRVDVRGGRAAPRLAVAGLLTLLVGLGVVLAGPARLALHACVPGQGPVGWLGLRLALLSGSSDCPEGTLALGGSTASSALVVASVAVPTLLLHLVAAICGVSLSAVLARAAAGVRAVFRAAWRVLPASPRGPWVAAFDVAGRDLDVVHRRVGDLAHPDRGPPVLAAA